MTTRRELTELHRAQQLLLRRATKAQIKKLWPALDWDQLDKSFPGFAVQVAALVEKNRQVSAGLASQYVRAIREANGLPPAVKVALVKSLNVEQFTNSLRVVSVVAAKNSATAGVAPDVAMANALTQTEGAMSRMVLDAGRETVIQTVSNDPDAYGYQRVVGGGACNFCQMLAGRGDVYSKDTADFESHDHCGCTAEPVYSAEQRNQDTGWRPSKVDVAEAESEPRKSSTDRDAERPVEKLRTTLAALERSLEKFDSPATRARISELRKEIARRS